MVVVHTHDEGFDLLKKGDITAYFADRTILQEMLRRTDIQDQPEFSEAQAELAKMASK